MSKILRKNGVHSILRYRPGENCYYGGVEEFGSDPAYQFQEADIEKAICRFEELAGTMDEDSNGRRECHYIPSSFEARRPHTLLCDILFYGVLWLALASGSQLILRHILGEENLFTAAFYILGAVVLWAVINIYSSHSFYELFLQIRPYYWFFEKGKNGGRGYRWYEEKAARTFRFFYEGKPTGLLYTTAMAMAGGIFFYVIFVYLNGAVFSSHAGNYIFLPAMILIAMYFAGASIWPMCSFFYTFFIDKSFAFRFSKVRFMNDEDQMTVFQIKKFFIYFSFVATFAYIQLLAGCWSTGILMQSKLTLFFFFIGSFFPLCMYSCALQFFKKLVDNVGMSHIGELDHVIEQNYEKFIGDIEDDELSYEKINQAIELKSKYYDSLKSHTSWDIGALLTTGISIASGLIAIFQAISSE